MRCDRRPLSLLWLLVSFLVLLVVHQSYSQEQPTPMQELQSIERSLLNILQSNETSEQSWLELRDLLAESNRRIENLERSLENSESYSEDLERQLAQVKRLYGESSEKVERLSQLFEDSSRENEKLRRNNRFWKGTTVAGVLAFLLALLL